MSWATSENLSLDFKVNLKWLSRGICFCCRYFWCCCDKISWQKQFRKCRVYCDSQFKGTQCHYREVMIMAEIDGHIASTVRKQREMSSQLALSFLFSLKSPTDWMVFPKLTWDLPISVNLISTAPHIHVQRLSFWVILEAIKLAINTSHHKIFHRFRFWWWCFNTGLTLIS